MPRSKPIFKERKVCAICLVEKKIENFERAKNQLVNGEDSETYRNQCKSCRVQKKLKRNRETDYYRRYYAQMDPVKKIKYIARKSKENKERPGAKETRQKYGSSDRGIYKSYANDCKRRGKLARNITMELTFDQFCKLINSPCTYCGTDNCRGVDRMDSENSYTFENSTPCCATCNRMKLDHSVESFKEHLAKILKHLTK